jgi:hypothetical protein
MVPDLLTRFHAQAIYGGLYHIPGTLGTGNVTGPHVNVLMVLGLHKWHALLLLYILASPPGQQRLPPSAAGVVVLGEGSLARQLFMNFVWLVGTYLFAAVLGVITGDIMERIQVHCVCPIICHSESDLIAKLRGCNTEAHDTSSPSAWSCLQSSLPNAASCEDVEDGMHDAGCCSW